MNLFQLPTSIPDDIFLLSTDLFHFWHLLTIGVFGILCFVIGRWWQSRESQIEILRLRGYYEKRIHNQEERARLQ